jgi:hypothetical protein
MKETLKCAKCGKDANFALLKNGAVIYLCERHYYGEENNKKEETMKKETKNKNTKETKNNVKNNNKAKGLYLLWEQGEGDCGGCRYQKKCTEFVKAWEEGKNPPPLAEMRRCIDKKWLFEASPELYEYLFPKKKQPQ